MKKFFEMFQLNLLFKELVLFAVIISLGLASGLRYYAAVPIEKMETGFSIWWFLGSFAVAVVIILLVIKFVKAKLPYKVLISMMIFIGSIYVLNAFVDIIPSAVIAAGLIGLYWSARNIAVHNLVIVIAIAGVSVYLGLLLPAMAVLVLLAVLSVYDVIAVFKTKHMITMFKHMAERGAMFSLIIPHGSMTSKGKVKDIKLGKSSKDRGAVIIGTGDAAFPTILAVSAATYGVGVSICVGIGALVGLVAVHFILMKTQRPLPALPPIALGSAAGFLIGVLI